MAKPVRAPPAARRGSLRDQIKAERAQAVLNVARELFYEKGFDDATTLEIAVRAGIGAGTLFKYFPTKDALLFAIINADLAELHLRASQQARSETGLLARLTAFYGQIVDFHVENAGLSRPFLRLLIAPTVEQMDSPFDFTQDLAVKTTWDFVGEASAAGELKPGLPLDDLSANCFSTFMDILNRTLMKDPSVGSPHDALSRRLGLQIAPLCS